MCYSTTSSNSNSNYNPKNDTKIYRIFFVRLFSEEIWKIPFCHFLNIFELLVMKQQNKKRSVILHYDSMLER